VRPTDTVHQSALAAAGNTCSPKYLKNLPYFLKRCGNKMEQGIRFMNGESITK
jgi:hypothetical protein